jgi:hypothetical protein
VIPLIGLIPPQFVHVPTRYIYLHQLLSSSPVCRELTTVVLMGSMLHGLTTVVLMGYMLHELTTVVLMRSMLHILLVFCAGFVFVLFVFVLCFEPNVIFVSRLSIHDCPFGFL